MYPPREDFPGADWLITNRGIAERAVFETRQDVERFFEAIAKVVAGGLIEVHAFVFLTTHFHRRRPAKSTCCGPIDRETMSRAAAYARSACAAFQRSGVSSGTRDIGVVASRAITSLR